jgi:hypothetical protein
MDLSIDIKKTFPKINKIPKNALIFTKNEFYLPKNRISGDLHNATTLDFTAFLTKDIFPKTSFSQKHYVPGQKPLFKMRQTQLSNSTFALLISIDKITFLSMP